MDRRPGHQGACRLVSDMDWDREEHGERKTTLHDALQLDLQEEGHEGAFLTKWVIIRELHMPNGTVGFSKVSGTADGRPLMVWEAQGMLVTALISNVPDLGQL